MPASRNNDFMNTLKLNTILLGILLPMVGTLGWWGIAKLSEQSVALATYAEKSENQTRDLALIRTQIQAIDLSILQIRLDLVRLEKSKP